MDGKTKFGAAILAAAMASGALIGCESKPTEPITVAPNQSFCVTYPVPEDGTKPTDHTGIENLGYLAQRLSEQSNYHVEIAEDVSAKVVIDYKQKVEVYKDWKDGVMIVTDISTSSLVNTAMQSCVMDGCVFTRQPASRKASSWNGPDTEWETVPPEKYTFADYVPVYGLFPTEFASYVINEDTLVSASAVTDLGDGRYAQTYTFDPIGASEYYRYRMKTMGGLAEYPEFHSIEATYVFDGDWRVLSSEYTEHYGIKLNALIHTDNCTAVTRSVYSYGNADVRAYDEFFAAYRDAELEPPRPQEKELGASDYLMEAFAPALAGTAGYDVRVAFDETELSGSIALNLPERALALSVGALTIGYREGEVSLFYRDLQGRIPLDFILSRFGFGAELMSDSAEEDEEEEGLDTDRLLEQLASGKLTVGKTTTTLRAELTLGDLTLPISFRFLEGETIALDAVEAQIERDGTIYRLSLTPSAQVAPIPAAAKEDLSPYVDLVFELLEAETHTATLAYQKGEIALEAELILGERSSAHFSLAYGDMRLKGDAALADGVVYLALTDVNGTPAALRISCAQTALTDVLGGLLSAQGDAQDAAESANLIETLLGIDFKEAIRSLALTERGLVCELNADALLAAFGVESELGTLSLTLGGGRLTGETAGLFAAIAAGGEAVSPEGEYTPLDPLLSGADALRTLLKSENYYITLDAALSYGGKAYPVRGAATLCRRDDRWLYAVDLSAAGKRVQLVRTSEQVIVILPDWNIQLEAKPDEAKHLAEYLIGRLGPKTEVGLSLDVGQLLASLELLPEEDGLLKVQAALEELSPGSVVTASIGQTAIELALNTFPIEGAQLSDVRLCLQSGEGKRVDCKEKFYVVYTGDIYDLFAIADAAAYRVSACAGEISADAVLSREGRADGKFSLSGIEGRFFYADGVVTLSLGSLSVSAGLPALETALTALLDAAATERIDAFAAAGQGADLIRGLLELNPRTIELGVEDRTLGARIDASALLSAFGMRAELPKVFLQYAFSAKQLSAQIDDLALTLEPSDKQPSAPADGAVSLDRFLESLNGVFALSATAEGKADGQRISLALDGELILREFRFRGAVSAIFDRTTVYAAFETDGETIALSFGSFGVRMRLDELSDFLAEVEETANTVRAHAERMPEGVRSKFKRVLAIAEALKLLDGIPTLSIELPKSLPSDWREVVRTLLADSAISERDGALGFSVSLGGFETQIGLRAAQRGEIESNRFYAAGQGAVLFERADLTRLQAGISALSALLESERYAIDYAFAVKDANAAYAPYGGVRYDAKGELRFAAGERAYLGFGLVLDARNDALDRDLYLDLVACDGDGDGETDVYLTVSRYPEGSADRTALRLRIPKGPLAEILTSVLRMAGVETDVFAAMPADFLARLDAFRMGGLHLSDLLEGKLLALLHASGSGQRDAVLNDAVRALAIDASALSLSFDASSAVGSVRLDWSEAPSLSLSTPDFDGTLSLSTAAFDLAAPTGDFIDAQNVMDLISMLLRSATHTEGGYRLNDVYAVSGDAVLSILSYEVKANIGIRVRLEADLSLTVDLRFATHAQELLGVILVQGDTVTDVSVRVPAEGEASVTMRREQTSRYRRILVLFEEELSPSEVVYRSMPLDAFFADILPQLGFILNLGDTILDAMNRPATPADGTIDYGKYLLSFSETEKRFELVLSGGALTGGVLGDLTVDLTHDGNVLTGLNVGTDLYSILHLKLDLVYENPGEAHGNVREDLARDVYGETVSAFGSLYAPEATIEGSAYLLTFRAGGAEIAWERYIPGSGFVRLPDVSGYALPGYTPSGWTPSLSEVTGHTTLDLVYTPNEYRVTLYSPYAAEGFEPFGEGYRRELLYTYDTVLPLPDAVVTDGRHRFGGWTLDGVPVTELSGILEDVTCELVGIEQARIVLESAFPLAECGVYLVDYGETFPLPAVSEITEEGYKFKAWTVDGVPVERLLVEADTIVTASWYDPVVMTLRSAHPLPGFEPEGEGYVLRIPVGYGERFVLPDFTGEGDARFVFERWTGDVLAESYLAETPLEFEAVWRESVPVTYRSAYPLDGFEPTEDGYAKIVYAIKGEPYDVETTVWMQDTGFALLGWQLDGEIVTAFVPNGAVTLVGAFGYRSVTVRLSLNGVAATGASEGETTFEADYALPAPQAEGYAFLGWWQEAESGWTQVKDAALLAEGTLLKAMWIGNATLRFDATQSGFLFLWTLQATLQAEYTVSEEIAEFVRIESVLYEWTIDTSADAPAYFAESEQGELTKEISQSASRNSWLHARATLSYRLSGAVCTEQAGSLETPIVSDQAN